MFPSIGLSVISSMIEVKFGIGFGHEFVFESRELVCTTGFLPRSEVVSYDCFLPHFDVSSIGLWFYFGLWKFET